MNDAYFDQAPPKNFRPSFKISQQGKGLKRYPHIFSPGNISKVKTKNRIKYAATETNFPFRDGYVSDREIAYMEAQARGGAGIVTTQGAYPDEAGEGKGFRGMMAIYDDRFIPGLARIAAIIRKHGALSALQILHCGREGGVELDYCLMPSVVPQKLSYFKPPREITAEEINRAVTDHIRAAQRAVAAGFDMIELSGIVGYLISTFISRYTNKRGDEYGGETIRERCRLMTELIQGVKAEVGDRTPVGIRLCGHELLDDRGGNTFEESVESFHLAEEAGADYVSVTVGWHESSIPVITRDVPMGHWLYVAKEVKKRVTIPVMMAFRQFLPYIPEEAIAQGTIDFWEACRPMIADPELPNKVAEGKEDEIVPCIACNLCFSRLYYHQPISCSVRPTVGHEAEPEWGYHGFKPSRRSKKITVIGGGPAGLKCASVAAQKGHEVVVYEKRAKLGGNILLASKVDEGADELMRPIAQLELECRKQGVDFRLNTEYTRNLLTSQRPDTVVIAAGGQPRVFPFNSPDKVYTVSDIITNRIDPPQKITVIGGNGVGLGVAVYLVRNGQYDLTIVEESTKLGRDVNPFYLWRYTGLLRKQKARFLLQSSVVGAQAGALRVSSPKGGLIVEADAVIMAYLEPFDASSLLNNQITAETYIIGDANKPRRLNNAIHDGFHLGMVKL